MRQSSSSSTRSPSAAAASGEGRRRRGQRHWVEQGKSCGLHDESREADAALDSGARIVRVQARPVPAGHRRAGRPQLAGFPALPKPPASIARPALPPDPPTPSSRLALPTRPAPSTAGNGPPRALLSRDTPGPALPPPPPAAATPGYPVPAPLREALALELASSLPGPAAAAATAAAAVGPVPAAPAIWRSSGMSAGSSCWSSSSACVKKPLTLQGGIRREAPRGDASGSGWWRACVRGEPGDWRAGALRNRACRADRPLRAVWDWQAVVPTACRIARAGGCCGRRQSCAQGKEQGHSNTGRFGGPVAAAAASTPLGSRHARSPKGLPSALAIRALALHHRMSCPCRPRATKCGLVLTVAPTDRVHLHSPHEVLVARVGREERLRVRDADERVAHLLTCGPGQGQGGEARESI